MPLPIVLIGIAAISAIYGGKKGVDAYRDKEKAGALTSEARNIFKTSKAYLIESRESTRDALDNLGKAKILAWDNSLARFVRIFSEIRNVSIEGAPLLEGMEAKAITKEQLSEMRDLSLKAREIVKGGGLAIGAGALTGLGSYGGAMTLASASTGTAISTLSGVAATNATLAWFGGGSLATGGLGMAGGMTVLGGLVAGPILAVGGMVLSAKARENLANAQADYAQAKQAAYEMNCASSVLNGIRSVADSFTNTIDQMTKRMTIALDDLESVVNQSGKDYARYSEGERKTVHLSVQFAQAVKVLTDTPILKEDGSLSTDYHISLNASRELLRVESDNNDEYLIF